MSQKTTKITRKSKFNDIKFMLNKRQIQMVHSVVGDCYTATVGDIIDALQNKTDKRSKVLLNNILQSMEA